ncbi:WXG100 family type VII secretion target [Paenibacillus algicola]|nr:WXG100 family type VII secretion target [Paenibacillus algicola]
MFKIIVPPEVLIQLSQQFHLASLQFEWTVNQLNHQMDTMLLWEGTTRQRFYADYDRARLDLKRVIELMESVSVELQGIAIKFRLLDEETLSYIPSSNKPEPKNWQDHAEDLWEGVKTGGRNIADSIVSTGEALIEDPIGTAGDMLYNATIGTAEEVIDTTVWGAKMAFDVGDTREKFDESVNAAGGRDQFIGQQGVAIASNFLLRRLGLKDHDDSGGGGGGSKKAEGTDNTVGNFAGNIIAENIPNMSKQEILDSLPKDWKYTDNNGFVHIRDARGNVRMKIDPPDKVTKYDHVHLFDESGNPIDVNLNVVDRKSSEAHIPYKK